MVSRIISRRYSELAARKLTPLRKGDPEANKPVVVDGTRVFPPTVDEFGTVTYYREFPDDWKPYSFNYYGHGWIIAGQVLFWTGLYSYERKMDIIRQKPRDT